MKAKDVTDFVGRDCWVEWADPDNDWHGQAITAVNGQTVTLRAVPYRDPVMGWATVVEGDPDHFAHVQDIASIRTLTEDESTPPRAGKPRGDKRATSRKVPVRASVRLNAYAVVMRAVEEGAMLAASRWSRKGAVPDGLKDVHLDSLRWHIDAAVSDALCEVLQFESEP